VISLLVLVVLPVILIGGWIWAVLHLSYSEGQRVGYVQKISKKGWVCKTWEGEMNVTPVPGAAAQLFQFTVPDPKVAEAIEQTSGRQVILYYEQHKGVPTTCFGETENYVTGVKPAQK
jgi:hypothetical protein